MKLLAYIFFLIFSGWCSWGWGQPVGKGDDIAGKVVELAYPRSVRPDGSLVETGAADWTSGFFPTVLYRETKDRRYLEQAIRAAGYFISRIDSIPDHIPYWDFQDPEIPNSPRDASAAAVAASGMIELSRYAGAHYLEKARELLEELCSREYLAEGMKGGCLAGDEKVEYFAGGNMRGPRIGVNGEGVETQGGAGYFARSDLETPESGGVVVFFEWKAYA